MSTPNINFSPLLVGTNQPPSGALGNIIQSLNWPSVQPTNSFTPGTGTGAGLVDTVWTSQGRTLASASNESLDLNGVLTDAFGASVALVRVKGIFIYAYAANSTDLTVGAGSNPFVGPLGGTTPTHTVSPGGVWIATKPSTGWTVTASTGDILKVANGSGASAQYDIAILGASS